MRWKILLLVLAAMIAVMISSSNNKSVVHADDTCTVVSAVKSQTDGAMDVTFDCGQGIGFIIHEPVWP